MRAIRDRTIHFESSSMNRSFLCALVAGLTLAAVPETRAQTGLARTERAIVAAVDPRNAEGLALLERLVNINSGTMNFAGVKQVGDVLRKELDALGFETRWVEGAAFN